MKVIKDEVVKHPVLGNLNKKAVYEFDETKFATLELAIQASTDEIKYYNKYGYSPQPSILNDLTDEDLRLLARRLKDLKDV